MFEYINDVPEPARTEYLAAEEQARAAAAGLWKDGERAFPPWDWRRGK